MSNIDFTALAILGASIDNNKQHQLDRAQQDSINKQQRINELTKIINDTEEKIVLNNQSNNNNKLQLEDFYFEKLFSYYQELKQLGINIDINNKIKTIGSDIFKMAYKLKQDEISFNNRQKNLYQKQAQIEQDKKLLNKTINDANQKFREVSQLEQKWGSLEKRAAILDAKEERLNNMAKKEYMKLAEKIFFPALGAVTGVLAYILLQVI